MFDLNEVVGVCEDFEDVPVSVTLTLTRAEKRVFDEKAAESKKLSEKNDVNFMMSRITKKIVAGWQKEREIELERQRREQERLQREAEEAAKRATLPTPMPSDRPRRGSQAA